MQATVTVPSGKRERTLSAIVNAAIILIAEKGLESSSIDDLMATAGMARGTFYNYFQCREEVLHAVIQRIQQDLITGVVSRLPTGRSPATVIACMLRGYLQFCHDRCQIGAVLLRIGGFSPWVKACHQEMVQGFSPVDEALLALCGETISYTSARTYLEGMSNNILSHLLGGRLSAANVEELSTLTLRGLGINEQTINESLATARDFAAAIALN